MAEPNAKLAALMREADYSHKSLARAVSTAATDAGITISCDHTYVARWLKGAVPRGAVPELIAATVGKRLGRRVTASDIGMSTARGIALSDGLGLEFAEQPEATVSTVAALLDADPTETYPSSHPHAQADPASSGAAALRWLVARSHAVPPEAESRTRLRVGMSEVRMVRTATEEFSRLDAEFGGGHGRPALVQYLRTEVRPMLDGTFSENVGKQLYGAAAEALRLAGWMSYDSGQHALAQRYFVQSLGLAHAADDRPLGGSVLSAMSHQATYLGRYQEAVSLARAAYTGSAARLGPTTAAQFRATEARALACLGEGRQCDIALSEAECKLGKRGEDSDPLYIAYFDDAELAAEISHCFSSLGRTAASAEHGENAVTGADGNSRSDFFASMILAGSYLSQGCLEQGYRIALDALSLGEGLKSARCLQYTRRFRDLITPRLSASATTAEFSEQARQFRLWRQCATA